MTHRIQVLIVDDSAVVRQVYREILESNGIFVMAAANDPYEAVKYISQSVPDVMIVDVEMPRMDGITFLRKVMDQRPIPTVVCSSYTAAASGKAFEAARAGAVEVLEKPTNLAKNNEFATRLCDAVKTASVAQVRVTKEGVRYSGRVGTDAGSPLGAEPREKKAVVGTKEPRTLGGREGTARTSGGEILAHSASSMKAVEAAVRKTGKQRPALIAIGASTGGTEAIRRIVSVLPAKMPPIVIVQHMPVGFTASFASWLDSCCRLSVFEANDGQPVHPGQVVVAKGGSHLRVRIRLGSVVTLLGDDPPVNRHRPSVDALFDSVVSEVGARAQGVLLTGMGDDGANGLLRLRQAGAITIAESEDSAVVFGMPREAIALGAAAMVMNLDEISNFLGSVQSDEVI